MKMLTSRAGSAGVLGRDVRLAGLKLSVRVDSTPVPLKPIDCGLPFALSVTEMEAARAPAAVGGKGGGYRTSLHLRPGAGVVGQVLPEMAKSPGFAPPSAKLVKLTALLPVLVTVTLCAALVVPVFCVANVRLPGAKPKLKFATWPVPLKPIDCGLPVALSVTEIAAVRVPPAVGENVALTEQALPAASEAGLAGHVLAEMAKSPGFAPANTKLVKMTALLPLLVTVTLCAALVVPVFCVAKVRLVGLKLSDSKGVKPVPLSRNRLRASGPVGG